MGLNAKLLLFFEIVLLIAVGTMLLLVRNQMKDQIVEDIQRELHAVAATASLQLDGDMIKTIRNSGDEDTPEFQRLGKILAQIRDANELKPENIYTFYRDGELVRFGLMTHEKPFVGDPYPLQPRMRQVFEEGMTNVTPLYEDEYGSWISAYAPIFDSSGNVVALLEVDRHATKYFEKLGLVTMINIALALIALAVSSVVGWYVLDKIVIRPMNAVNGGVRALARQDFTHRVRLRTRDEFEALGNALNHLSDQLNVARSVQASFIPRNLPDHAGYQFALFSEPCDTTAGDYVDAFALDENRVAVLVADVTGHGIGPSLLMAACRSALRALSTTPLRPCEMIQRLDRLLAQDLTEGRFITMIFGILESDGTFTFCNAGHGPALILTRAGVAHLPSHRPPLGIEWDLDEDDPQTVIRLQPGDRILLASDGVSEAISPTGEQFGTDRMAEIVSDRSLNAKQVVEKHREAMQAHCRSAKRTDDVTLLCIDRVTEVSERVTAFQAVTRVENP